jgi:regulator of RNase E activity RraA
MLDRAIHDALVRISTATITTLLLKRGLRNVWLRRTRRLTGSARVVGPAFTMRFVAFREDLANPASWSSPTSTRACVEAMPAGAVVVADAIGCADAGILGDILCARMKARGVAGLVTDGAVRDIAGIRSTGLEVWAAGIAAPPAVAALHFVGWEEPVSCGGVAVLPGDLIVADDDGAVVIPAALVSQIAEEGEAQERLEAWTLDEVIRGRALAGLYPLDDDNRRRYEAERAASGPR